MRSPRVARPRLSPRRRCVVIGGRAKVTGRSFRTGAMRSRHRRSATVSPQARGPRPRGSASRPRRRGGRPLPALSCGGVPLGLPGFAGREGPAPRSPRVFARLRHGRDSPEQRQGRVAEQGEAPAPRTCPGLGEGARAAASAASLPPARIISDRRAASAAARTARTRWPFTGSIVASAGWTASGAPSFARARSITPPRGGRGRTERAGVIIVGSARTGAAGHGAAQLAAGELAQGHPVPTGRLSEAVGERIVGAELDEAREQDFAHRDLQERRSSYRCGPDLSTSRHSICLSVPECS
jgi:hypothetical protein